MTQDAVALRQREQRFRNLRLAWVLACVALAFFLGFVLHMVWHRG